MTETAPRAPKRCTIIEESELADLPEPEPIIEGIIYADTLVSIVAPSDSFKSFLALDWAMCIASGTPWNGRKVERGAVLYIYAEGTRGIRPRVTAWRAAHRFTDPMPLRLIPHPVPITDPSDVHGLLVQLDGDYAEYPAVIFVDTVARNFSGNENGTEDMNRYVAGCDTLRVTTGATIVSVHHAGWVAERSRGSSVLPAAVDTEVTLVRDGERVTVKCTKQKDAERFADIELETVRECESLVLFPVGPRDEKLTTNQEKCLTVVQADYGDEGARATEWLEATGLKKSSFNHARKRLVERGFVKHSRGKYHITDAGRLAISGPRSNAGTTQVQSAGPEKVQWSNHLYIGDGLGPGALDLGLQPSRFPCPGGCGTTFTARIKRPCAACRQAGREATV